MDELMRQEVNRMIDESLSKKLIINSQKTPFHTHNGIDSIQIELTRLLNNGTPFVGATGSFVDKNDKAVTVVNGIITSIVQL